MCTRPQGARDQSNSVIVLAQLTPGKRATVVGTVAEANPVIVNRLGQLGFRAKARVDVIRRAPLGDPTIYPDAAVMAKLYTISAHDQKTQRLVNRLWTRIKTGR